MQRCTALASTSVDFPDCRGTVSPSSVYASRPVRGSTSSATSATSCCHGISGLPSFAAAFPTAGPSVARSGLLFVPNRGGQLSVKVVVVIHSQP